MFSLYAFALTVSFLLNTMMRQSVCTFIITGKVGTIVVRASETHPSPLHTQESFLFSFSAPTLQEKKNHFCYYTKILQLCSWKKPSRVGHSPPRISPAFTLRVHSAVSPEDAIGSNQIVGMVSA